MDSPLKLWSHAVLLIGAGNSKTNGLSCSWTCHIVVPTLNKHMLCLPPWFLHQKLFSFENGWVFPVLISPVYEDISLGGVNNIFLQPVKRTAPYFHHRPFCLLKRTNFGAGEKPCQCVSRAAVLRFSAVFALPPSHSSTESASPTCEALRLVIYLLLL